MKRFRIGYSLIIFALVGLFAADSAVKAQNFQLKPVGEPLNFKKLNQPEANDDSIEPSAVVAINDKFLLVADDKTQNLLVVETGSGNIVKPLPISADEKPKWEAMARDGDFFYIIGSHNVKLDPKDSDEKSNKKLKARSHLFRFRLKNADSPNGLTIEAEGIEELDIKDSLAKFGYSVTAKDNKVKIEGLAFRVNDQNKKELIFGLREPSEKAALVYSAAIPDKLTNGGKLTVGEFFKFDAGKTADNTPLKISSIEYAPQLKGFFILTSSETTVMVKKAEKPVFHGNRLLFVSDEAIKKSPSLKLSDVREVGKFDAAMKPEGLSILPNPGKDIYRLAVVFDNDTEDAVKAQAADPTSTDKVFLGMMQLVEVTKLKN